MSRLLSILVRICLLKPVLCLTGQKNNSSGDMGSFFMFCKLFFMNRQLTSYWLSDVILADLNFLWLVSMYKYFCRYKGNENKQNARVKAQGNFSLTIGLTGPTG